MGLCPKTWIGEGTLWQEHAIRPEKGGRRTARPNLVLTRSAHHADFFPRHEVTSFYLWG